MHPPHIRHTVIVLYFEGDLMKQVCIALGSPEKFVKLGDFNIKVRDQSMNVYYNIDLGDNKTKMFDLNSGIQKNVEEAHQSFHSSGLSHTKMEAKGAALCKGQTSDGSPMNDVEKTPLILGIESFHLDAAPKSAHTYDPSTVFLSPPNKIERYSILWLWMPVNAERSIHPRWFYKNFIGNSAEYGTFQTAGIGDLAIELETQTVVVVNGWEIRALFLKFLIPFMKRNVMLQHPKGVSQVWRSHVFVDPHLPLSEMVGRVALGKKPVLFTGPYHISPEAKTPMPWAKKKK